jgi:hypothetical protein
MNDMHLAWWRVPRLSGPAQSMRRIACLLAVLATPLHAQGGSRQDEHAVPVRYSQGTEHAFLELRTEQDSLLAQGDLLQVPGDSSIETRMILRFVDQSVFEETTNFTQHQVFRMESYHIVQRGPAFSADVDATLSRDGRYAVTNTDHDDGKTERYAGRLDLPSDIYNGLAVVIAMNLRSGDTANVHLVAFTPKPRLIGLQIAFAGTDTVMLGTHPEPTAHFVLKPQLGSLTTFFAKLLGKLPPNGHVWIVMDQVPAFIRFEGPMYLGPVWRLSLTTPTRPKAVAPQSR